MDPWGATEPMGWWTVINRARAIENIAFVVAANQGASLRHYPPYSWPGGSQIVDFDGRLLAQASPGPGERIVVAPVDVSALRHERQARVGHHMLAHLRADAYRVYERRLYPPREHDVALSQEENVRRIQIAKEGREEETTSRCFVSRDGPLVLTMRHSVDLAALADTRWRRTASPPTAASGITFVHHNGAAGDK
jgi:hypothetical protein